MNLELRISTPKKDRDSLRLGGHRSAAYSWPEKTAKTSGSVAKGRLYSQATVTACADVKAP